MKIGPDNAIVISNHLYPTCKSNKFWRNECVVNYNYIKGLNHIHGSKKTGDIGIWKLIKLKIKL